MPVFVRKFWYTGVYDCIAVCADVHVEYCFAFLSDGTVYCNAYHTDMEEWVNSPFSD